VTPIAQFHDFLLDHAQGRVRVEQELLWRALQAVHPEVSVTTEARAKLRDLIDQLALDGFCETPKGREGWDQSSLPLVPKWIRLPNPRPPANADDLRRIPWAPELRFLVSMRTDLPLDDLLKLQRFFADGGRQRPVVPVKERSLQIFGDEKRLDSLRKTTLFPPGRLTLEALRCEAVGEPLAWKCGPNPGGPVIIVENAATWHSYSRWNIEQAVFSAVVYGKGLQAAESICFLCDVFDQLGGPRRVLYFGDLDPPGLRIPQLASAYALAHDLPAVEPDLWSYRQLLALARGKETVWEGSDPLNESDFAWLGELAEPIKVLLESGKRLAQEHLGWEFLSQMPSKARVEPR
jgi:Wadjet anti plasmid transformation system JetA-like protein